MFYIECKEDHKHFCDRCGVIPMNRTYSQEAKKSSGGIYLIKICVSCMNESELKAYKKSLLKAPKVTVPGEELDGQLSLL